MVSAADIDETVRPGEPARDYVARMAREKALAVRARGMALPVLAADTTVVVDELICGKPRDRGRVRRDAAAPVGAHAPGADRGRARGPAGRRGAAPEREHGALPRAHAAECVAYWDSGEPRDKAGGYAIQGQGAVFIEPLSGSYSGVMGLPLFETAQLLHAAGVPCWQAAAAGGDAA